MGRQGVLLQVSISPPAGSRYQKPSVAKKSVMGKEPASVPSTDLFSDPSHNAQGNAPTTIDYANFSIDDEIANSLNNLGETRNAETFASNTKIMEKALKHHNKMLKDNREAIERRGKRTTVMQAQLNILAARVDVLEGGFEK